MATLSWPPLRPHATATAREPRFDPRDPASVLRAHPVLLLTGPPADTMVKRLLRSWNPLAVLDGPVEDRGVAEGVRWVGPYRLDAVGAAEAGLPAGWTTAYAALTARSRMRVPDGAGAEELRRRFPYGMPTGTEAVAWSLVTGLARKLDGAARLPSDGRRREDERAPAGEPRAWSAMRALGLGDRRSPRARARAANELMVLRPRKQRNTYCVYGNEALPWSVLRSVLRLYLPELDRNGALAANDYCLDRADHFEVRVEPFREGDFLPYAVRPRAAAGWPCTVYRVQALPQSRAKDADRIDIQLRGAAFHLADVVGGLALDGEGFPVTLPVPARR
jgi:hypothetical protein